MRISSNSINETSLNQNFQTRINRTKAVQKDYNAFRLVLSQRALNSDEYNNPEFLIPIHNPDALQYTQNMKIIYNNV